MKKITLLLAAFVLFTSCDGLFDFPNTSGLKVNNISDLSMETTLGCHVNRTWTFDEGGSLSYDESRYYTANTWSDIHCSQNGSRLSITAKGTIEDMLNGDHRHDISYTVIVEIDGFTEPFDNCKVSSLKFNQKDIGEPVSSAQYWLRGVDDLDFTLKNIPVVVKPSLYGDSGTALISFSCDNSHINVFSFSEKVSWRTAGEGSDIYLYKYIGGSMDHAGLSFSFDY